MSLMSYILGLSWLLHAHCGRVVGHTMEGVYATVYLTEVPVLKLKILQD